MASQECADACGVCGDGSTSCYKLYGSECLVCLSCKTFFSRMVKNHKIKKCKNKDEGTCSFNKWTRNLCRKCRYETCLKVGMDPFLVNHSKTENINKTVLAKKIFREKEETIPPELGIFSVSMISSWFKDHIQTIHEKICEETFMKSAYSSIISGLGSINKQSVEKKRIVVDSDSAMKYHNYISQIGWLSLKSFLPNCSDNSINQLNQANHMVIVSLLGGLEHCFRHKSLLFQALSSYQCPHSVLESLKKENPGIETMKGIPLEEYEICASPWANSAEDEEYVELTYAYLEKFIENDQELSKMIILLVFFSPLKNIQNQEAGAELTEFQRKVRMVIYNHLMNKPDSTHVVALDMLTKLGQVIHRLIKCGEIMKSSNIFPLGSDFKIDPFDLNAIEVYNF